ncbi:MAG: ribosome biogenesis GTPase Der [Mariniblastus sp.]|nr:ribosome biogenesis GTPase Der [Mariniblastus sp.]
MSIPQISIVGRPNVGKSSIFNWLAGRRLAIVDDMAGVTRDRMTFLLQEKDRYFEIVDTGGIGINDVDELDEEIEQQIELGIQGADVLMFVVDARDGFTSLDQSVARRLRNLEKPVFLVANKCDGENWEIQSNEFFKIGMGEPVAVSAKNNRHKSDLLNTILENLPSADARLAKDIEAPEMKLAMVGRRNVGKSTLINTITESDRMIVSPVAGTTRDSVDVRIEIDGKSFVAIDTPGLRRGKSVRTDVEFYGTHRAHRTIRHADVILMMFDCSQRISKVDRKLCSYIESYYKPCILVVNKWDLMADHMATERWADYLRDNFGSLWNAPIAFITGKDGRNVKKMLNHAQMIYKQSLDRVATPKLNKIVQAALEHHPPPIANRRRPKIYYATQIGVQPPTIVLKCNDPNAFPKSYRKYLLGVLRDTLSFGEIPIRMVLEKRGSSDEKNELDRSRVRVGENKSDKDLG